MLISISDMRPDYYALEICDIDSCNNCDAIQIPGPDEEWSEVKCGIAGDRLLVTKKVATQFQLTEIEVYAHGELNACLVKSRR